MAAADKHIKWTKPAGLAYRLLTILTTLACILAHPRCILLLGPFWASGLCSGSLHRFGICLLPISNSLSARDFDISLCTNTAFL